MKHRRFFRWGTPILTAALAGLVAWPSAGLAQLGLPLGGTAPAVTGQARAVQASVVGGTIALADTGTLSGSDDARHASTLTGGIPSLLDADTLHATTIGGTDQSSAEASLANLNVTVAGNGISAGFVMAEALARADGSSAGTTSLDGLVINGVTIAVTGAANQTIPILGGRVVVNEQRRISSRAIAVSGLHIVIYGVVDVVIASATAGH